MKPAPFAYERPATIEEALGLLAGRDGAKIIAGGQSLGPMLNLRLAAPPLLVDIAGIAALKTAEVHGDELVIGACITHADIEDRRIPDVTRGAMAKVAGAIAYRAVRNRGTIGGSVSHADPSADWVSVLTALDVKLTLSTTAGTRSVAMEDFIRGALESALRPDEMVTEARVPRMSKTARWGYAKACRKTGEFAHAIGAVLVDPEAGIARIVIGATDGAPLVVQTPEALFGGRIAGDFGTRFDGAAVDALLAKAGIENAADRHIRVAVLRRAVTEAAR